MREKTGESLRFFLITVLAILAACKPAPISKPADEVRLQLKWLHQPQFAGFYVAQEKGYYAKENLKVTFLEGGAEVDISERVLHGQAEFGVFAPEDLLQRRSEGAPLTALAVLYRRSAVVFVARADSGIERPEHFLGKAIAASSKRGAREFQILLLAMIKKLGLDPVRIKIVAYDPSFTDFLSGRVPVTACYTTGGLVKLRSRGLNLNIIHPDDYGVHFYSDTLATREETIAQKPDLVLRFLRASLKGWQEAIENYPEAVRITQRYAPHLPRELQTAMMEAMLPLVHTGEDRIGWMRPEIWQQMIDILAEQGLLKGPVEGSQVFTLRFLQEVYGEKKR